MSYLLKGIKIPFFSKMIKEKKVSAWVWFFLGGIGALVFPPFTSVFWGYASIISFLLYVFCNDYTKKRLFGLSYVYGIGFYIVGFGWINNALLLDDDLVQFVPFVVFAIGLFFGLFWSVPFVISWFGKNIYSKMLYFCSSFIFVEWIRSFIFTGFPWNLFGTALAFDVKLLQGASVIGTYGLSLCLMLMLCGIVLLLKSILDKKVYWGAVGFIVIPLVFILVCANTFVGSNRNGDIKVRLVQPNIPQTYKWDSAKAYENFRKHIDMSKSSVDDEIDLVVWGEAAVPYPLDRDINHLIEVTEAIPANGFLVTGLLRGAMEYGEIVAYNSLFVINERGDILDYYDKSHLVPFGEYLPFREYLPDFMRPVTNIVGTLGKGEKYKNIKVNGLPLMGGAICYESIFPGEVVNKKEKPEILLVLVNDGWYGISAGPYQHLVASQMRAIEEGVTVIRSANTGVSAVIADNGEILGEIGLNVAGVVDVVLPKILSHSTFYGKFGNIIPLSMAFVLLILAYIFDKYRKKSRTSV